MIRKLLDTISGVSFNRGLALGAMVGAAIAGSTIWSRFRQRGRTEIETGEDTFRPSP
jgi:hypothetical protein